MVCNCSYVFERQQKYEGEKKVNTQKCSPFKVYEKTQNTFLIMPEGLKSLWFYADDSAVMPSQKAKYLLIFATG